MRKIVAIYSNDAKKLSQHNIFTAENQLDAYAMLVDILENEVENGKIEFSNSDIQNIFATNQAVFGNEKLAIIDWDGNSCPVKTATMHFIPEEEEPKKRKRSKNVGE